MKGEKKFFIGIIAVTLAIITGGVFFLTRSEQAKQPDGQTGKPVDFARLMPTDSPRIARDSTDKTQSPKVTLVEFADFQCPACATYHPILTQAIAEFPQDLVYVFRHYPLPMHQNARRAAAAAESAGNQGKFFEMHDTLFTNQKEWSTLGNPEETFVGYAKELKLDADRFQSDLKSPDIDAKIQRDIKDGDALGVTGTPTFFLNGEKIANPRTLDDFRTLIKAAILKAPVNQSTNEPAYHAHADFKVFVDGKPLDFTRAKYQSTEDKELNHDVHLHDGNGDVLHMHRKGIVLGTFFESLGFSLTDGCLTLDTGTKHCSSGDKTLKLYINSAPSTIPPSSYEPQDLDRILLSYGSESGEQITSQLVKVTDRACIYSEKCPERGTPPPEACVGGLGSGCEK